MTGPLVRLPTRAVEKPWGRERMPAPFAGPPGKRIGEIWFEPPPGLPDLLVKYIFTSEKLSVQVHPNDAQARAAGAGPSGKEECWLVIGAEPAARLGVGFREPIEPEAMRAAALDGSIEDRIAWHPVRVGDFFYVPAGTVHAIGAGIGLIEVQQNADITYRLYDFGRPRELHLDAGIAVACGAPHDPALRVHLPARGTARLADGRHFALHRLDGAPDAGLCAEYAGPCLVIPRDGEVRGAGVTIGPGECGLASSLAALDFSASRECLVARAK